MAMVYIVGKGGESTPMTRTHCMNEDLELQALLEKNLDLLPGDQINPDDHRRWLLVKREMPVPDPGTGLDRWSIDFFLVDQDATPTFVECKRFKDTRSRREVVGQILEYAANGHHYWSGDLLKEFAEKTVQTQGLTLEESLENLRPDSDMSPEEFFNQVQQNLREGQVRLLFFMEDSPFELRSVVDFLNRQMERAEVLLVEARQYAGADMRLVVPTLFGYTEEARMAKRHITITKPSARRKWDETSFFKQVQDRHDETDYKAIKAFSDQCISSGFEIGYGTGTIEGSFTVYERSICPRSFVTVWTNGNLSLNFGWLQGTELAERARDTFKRLLIAQADIHPPNSQKYPSLSLKNWIAKGPKIILALKQTVDEVKGNEQLQSA